MDTRKTLACLLICAALSAWSPLFGANEKWTKTYGGKGNDRPYSIEQTEDGGYIIAGSTDSYGAGKRDFWILQLDPAGELVWQTTLGGRGNDAALKATQLAGGNYLVAGTSDSLDGRSHVSIARLDNQGSTEWETAYGDREHEMAETSEFFQVMSDGGSIIGAWTSDDDEAEHPERATMHIMKVDESGNPLWQNSFEFSAVNVLRAIQPTRDHGYIATGYALRKSTNNQDLVVLKLDRRGKLLWKSSLGGDKTDQAYSIQETADDGFVVAGTTASFGAGDYDMWVVRLNPKGAVVWQKAYGGNRMETACSVRPTADGGYIVAGSTESFDSKKQDILLMKLDANGAVQWQRLFGGDGNDTAAAVAQTVDHTYILTGRTESFGAGKGDIWVLKLDQRGNAAEPCDFCRTPEVALTETSSAVQ